MREVFVHQDTARVGLYKSILDANGIPNFVRNALSNNSVTDMPAAIFFPALCVLEDADYERAVEILRLVHKPEPSDAPDWKCAACGEEVPGTFEECWKCGASCADKAPTFQAAADQPRTAIPCDPAPSAIAETNLRAAGIFRWLVLLNALLGIILIWVIPHFQITPPAVVSDWLREQDTSPAWLVGIAKAAWTFRDVLWGFAMLLCFALCNPGRLLLIATILVDALASSVFPVGFYPKWVSAVYFLQSIITGALLGMTFLSPLRERFSRKPRSV